MFYSKPLRWPRNRNPLRGMWGRRSDQEAAGNLPAAQRQEWTGSSLGARTENRSEAKTSAPASGLTAMQLECHALSFAQLLYRLTLYIHFCGSYRIQGDYQGLSAFPLCFTDDKKYAYHHSLSLKEALLCWRADDKESSGQTPINLIICGEGRQQGMKPVWWQIAHRLRHWINSLENSRMLPLYRNPHCI